MSAPISARKLDIGWAASPGIRVRQATPADMPAVRDLALLAGVKLDDELIEAVASGAAGQALRAGLDRGEDGFTRYIAGQFAAHWDQRLIAYLSAALVLVAVDRDDGVVGALVAYPPPNVAEDHLATVDDNEQRGQLLTVGAIGVAKIKAVAVTPEARGRNIGTALIQRAREVYFTCGYMIVYGTMTAAANLPGFYQRCGFQVLEPGEALDLWVVFGMHSRIEASPSERFFIRYKPSGQSSRNVGGRGHTRKHGKRR
jgi:ribosomal protein S18 acetylase RimI-like enzyme